MKIKYLKIIIPILHEEDLNKELVKELIIENKIELVINIGDNFIINHKNLNTKLFLNVNDSGEYIFLDERNVKIISFKGYAPKFLDKSQKWGDYLDFEIKNSIITNFPIDKKEFLIWIQNQLANEIIKI